MGTLPRVLRSYITVALTAYTQILHGSPRCLLIRGCGARTVAWYRGKHLPLIVQLRLRVVAGSIHQPVVCDSCRLWCRSL